MIWRPDKKRSFWAFCFSTRHAIISCCFVVEQLLCLLFLSFESNWLVAWTHTSRAAYTPWQWKCTYARGQNAYTAHISPRLTSNSTIWNCRYHLSKRILRSYIWTYCTHISKYNGAYSSLLSLFAFSSLLRFFIPIKGRRQHFWMSILYQWLLVTYWRAIDRRRTTDLCRTHLVHSQQRKESMELSSTEDFLRSLPSKPFWQTATNDRVPKTSVTALLSRFI